MSNKKYILSFVLLINALLVTAQKVNVVKGETISKVESKPFISSVYNNKVCVANRAKNKFEVTVFDAGTMAKTTDFSLPLVDKDVHGEEVFFMENKILVRYFNYPGYTNEYFDVYDYSGKSILKAKELVKHKFKGESGDILGSEVKISPNGKWLLLGTNGGNKKGKDYNVFDSDLKSSFNKTVKYEGENSTGIMMFTVLTDNGDIGQLIKDEGGSRAVRFIVLDKTTGTFKAGKTLLNSINPSPVKAFYKANHIYLGGMYENLDEINDAAGAYSVKINLNDLSVVDFHDGKFTDEQKADYYNKRKKMYKQFLIEKKEEPHIFGYQITAIVLDKNEDLVFSLTSVFEVPVDTRRVYHGVNITQFVCSSSGSIKDFNVMYITQVGVPEDAIKLRFGHVVASNGETIVQIYNDDKDNLGVMIPKGVTTPMQRNNKIAALYAENKGDEADRKLLVQSEKNIIIFPGVWSVSDNACYVAGAMDGETLVLLKIAIE